MKGKFVIAEPCHEKWDEMTPVDQGRFCASCAKCVFDFTNKTEEDILDAYKANEGNVCGRFRRGQVEVKQQRPALRGMRRGALRRLQLFAASLLMIFGVGTTTLSAQTVSPPPPPEEPMILGGISYHEAYNAPVIDVQLTSNQEVLDGELILMDKNGEELERIHVTAPGAYSFYSSGPGRYTVICRVHGFEEESRELKLRKGDGSILTEFDLRTEQFDMGLMIVEPPIYEEPIDISVDSTAPVDKTLPEPPAQLAASLKAWPNPSGDLIHIDLRSNAGVGVLQLTDLQGRVLRTVIKHRGHLETDEIDISDLPNGIYLLRWEADNESASFKIVKED